MEPVNDLHLCVNKKPGLKLAVLGIHVAAGLIFQEALLVLETMRSHAAQ
jgi:hypothetical protein